tara:strand:- start:10539 stop:11318 length:780 start_codon:yes stop_codon:yes gene_type:complete
MELNKYFLSPDAQVLIGEGWVYHGRPADTAMGKPGNHFKYSLFNLLIPLHQKNALSSLKRFSFLSLKTSDYLSGSDGDLFTNAKEFIQQNLGFAPDVIWLQTLPKILGYSFNPISFWFCYSSNRLDGILCEVNNTFGDRHFYFVKSLDGLLQETHMLPKQFHVSPFFPISGSYTFEFSLEAMVSDIKITLKDIGKIKLDTRLFLNLEILSNKQPWEIFKKYKWLTVAVIFRIHFQAFRLWLKGINFYRRPSPPEERFTL